MQIIRARAYGMCFGVRDAIALAERAAAEGPVTVLGPLVHNPTVVESLHERGVDVANHPGTLHLQPQERYLITAHGVSDTQRAAWAQSGASVQDTTCPLVRRAHHRLQDFVARGFHPVVIGKKGHIEVRGLTGDYSGAVVIETEADIVALPESVPLGVVSQTTQPIERVRDLVTCIRLLRPQQVVAFADTVCQPTKDRQEALRELCTRVELVIAVGGRESNNTRQLVLSAQTFGARAYAVEAAEDLRAEWFVGVQRAGLTAGTSTPDHVIEAVEAAMQRIGDNNETAFLAGRETT